MAFPVIRLLLFGVMLLSVAGPASAGRRSQVERRRAAPVRLQAQPAFFPGAEVGFNYSLPAGKVEFTLLRADLGELTQQLLAQSPRPVDLSNAPVVRTWTESADPQSPGAFNRRVAFPSPEPGVYVLEARWGEGANQVRWG